MNNKTSKQNTTIIKDGGKKCPECGETIVNTGGCIQCPSCGYNKCE